MKTVLGLMLFLGFSVVSHAEEKTVTFYAQLIRASDQDLPQNVSWRPVGPKLSRQLCPKFRWKNYWEVNRHTMKLSSGGKARVKLNAEREVEVELKSPTESEVRLFHGGKLVQKSKQSLESSMSIMGGTRENDESWFVVVRRDKPTVD